MKNLKLLLLLPFILLASCKKATNSECGNIPFETLSFKEHCIPFILNNQSDEDCFFVVNSLSELRAILSFQNETEGGNCDNNLENIDFNKKTLLIGKKATNYQNPTLTDQAISKDCDNNVVTYTANIADGGYAALDYHIFAVLVNKISDQTTVRFNIKLQQRN